MKSVRFILIAFIAFLLKDASAWKLEMVNKIEPTQLSDEGEVTILCQSDEPLISCQFAVIGDDTRYPLIDFSHGSRTKDVLHKYPGGDWDVYNASYHGKGLEKGMCGITLTDVWYVQFLVGCRARTASGSWKQADTGVQASRIVGSTPFHVDISTREAVVFPDSPLTLECKSASPLDMCAFTLPLRARQQLIFGKDLPPLETTDYSYHGRGMDKGDCGLHTNNVTERDNGPWWCSALTMSHGSTARTANIIVAKPPTRVELTLTTGASFKPGDTLSAICKVSGGRPAAHITWYLGDSDVSNTALDMSSSDDAWTWPWDQQIRSQKLSVVLRREHDGQMLKCKATHVALKEILQKEVKIVVQ